MRLISPSVLGADRRWTGIDSALEPNGFVGEVLLATGLTNDRKQREDPTIAERSATLSQRAFAA